MNFHPSTYPVPQMLQMPQQLPYGHPAAAPTQRTPLQMPPHQSPGHGQFYNPAGFMPGNRPQIPPQHQHMQLHPDPSFPPNQPYQSLPPQQLQQLQHLQQPHQQPQPSPSFYGPPSMPGNIPTSMSVPHQSSPQGYSPNPNNLMGSNGSPAAPFFSPHDPSAPPIPSQLSQSMPAPAPPIPPTNSMSQRPTMPNGGMAQPSHMHDPSQQPGSRQGQGTPHPPQSPQSLGRERARVAVLLEINAHLLKEVVTLQGQGKAGGPPALPQQSPTQAGNAGSPPSATDPTNPLMNSPTDPTKSTETKPPSQEYNDCMRRLQANLAYLASQADAKKRPMPAAPVIMVPPTHLSEVHDLYKKLNSLFPGAAQATAAKNAPSGSGNQLQNAG